MKRITTIFLTLSLFTVFETSNAITNTGTNPATGGTNTGTSTVPMMGVRPSMDIPTVTTTNPNDTQNRNNRVRRGGGNNYQNPNANGTIPVR